MSCIVAGLIIVGTPFSLFVWVTVSGGSFDPTDPGNYDHFALRNDTGAPRYVRLCTDPNCRTFDQHFDWELINPGSVDVEDVYWGPGMPTAYAVASSPTDPGRRCLMLDASKRFTATLDTPLSSAQSCG